LTSPGSPGNPTDSSNRRSHDRVHARFPIDTDHEGKRVRIEAVNLSEGGAYCISQVAFPLMTKLEVSFELPAEGQGGQEAPMRMHAVVVRCEPHPTVGANWNLALFFANPGTSARERLSRFLRTHGTAAEGGGPGSGQYDS
jgi:hypothetical protein